MSSLHIVSSPERLLRTCFLAKDGNRPHLMSSVFGESVVLEMIVKTGTISFPPPATRGLADRLVATIEAMPGLDPRELRPAMAGLAALPYPCCAAARIVSSAPSISALGPVFRYLVRSGPVA